MSDEEDTGLERARAEAERRGVGGYGRHVFICTGPDCVAPEEGMAAWTRLKSGVGELNKREGATPIYRTKVGCLRICESGPTAVVYPEGRWYAGMRREALDRVIAEDLGEGRPVEDYLIGENPLSASD
ncbi:MAG: (2Fe-2S) ferredoxin domain-containing protein [Dehalococcoidia bacterium]|nr:(2Fe-2S) ferredoxin domain-containing protein [Dehalococcoidia bacterium]MYA52808.1 (2Fe-2S) ferredoxin domain-containing protein [Dehalococcoidia bacterium]